jgi:5-methylcytosine-specific restriction protein A
MTSFPKPCRDCGAQAVPGQNRCARHMTPRPTSCRICPRRALAGESFCALHLPTEADRLARAPYRHAYTKAQYRRRRARRFKLAGGLCEACGVTLSAGWQCDHLIPLVDGGTNALSNLRALCAACHAKKTISDRQRRK